MFLSPATQIGRSGGTAPFFALELQPQEVGKNGRRSKGHYIGKDLAHARDEQGFYVDSAQLVRLPGWELLREYMIEFAGVQTIQCVDASRADLGQRELLVLRNLFDSKKETRLLDIKMGKYTADGGWKGKSHFAAFRNNTVDKVTNSYTEGYRLEGFDGIPSSLETFDPLEGMVATSEKKTKKARRLQFQWMPAKVFISSFLDCRPDNGGPPPPTSTNVSPAEYSEAVLRGLCLRMARLCRLLPTLPVPQKWIGSSIALGFDAGVLPRRGAELADCVSKTEVCIFDWGRSELLTPNAFEKLSSSEKKDRKEFWAQYRAGALRLYYELCRAYYHRFTCVSGWKWVRITVWDYDAGSADDEIGYADVRLEDTGGVFRQYEVYQPKSVTPLIVQKQPCRLEVRITRTQYPPDSVLGGGWAVHVGGVTGIPNMDIAKNMISKLAMVGGGKGGGGASDGYFTVTAMQDDYPIHGTKGGAFGSLTGGSKQPPANSARQPKDRSHCILNNNAPKWNEGFEFVTPQRPPPLFVGVFGAPAPFEVDDRALSLMFPPMEAEAKAELEGVQAFLRAVGMRDDEAVAAMS